MTQSIFCVILIAKGKRQEMENKNKKIIIIVSIIVLLLLISGASYFIYQMINKGDEKESNLENDKDNYVLEIQLNQSGNSCTDTVGCITYKIKTESKDAKFLTTTGYKSKKVFILYDDNGLKLYNPNGENKIQKLNLKNDYDGGYEIKINEKTNEVIGIIYLKRKTE